MWKAVKEAIQTTGRTLRFIAIIAASALAAGSCHRTEPGCGRAPPRRTAAGSRVPGRAGKIPPPAQPFRRPLPVAGVGGVKAAKSHPSGGDNGIRPPQGRLPSG